jgi:crotonobetainyl-CoA:carnitine CoA-transferase CaiB-like acyl-CoA transferase
MTAPLSDITVIEVDSWMAAPSAGAILADLGATVIKVEPIGGDPMRGNSRPAKVDSAAQKGYDFQFDVDNRGKESIAVAMDQPEGAALVRELVKGAQVFMCNLLPQRQRKFGLDADALLALQPRLVHATFTGYGSDGPDAQRPGYDVTAFFGRSGLYDAMREGADGAVPMARPAQGDHTAGLALFAAIVTALRQVERTGQGQVVETSLYETAVWTQASDFAVTAVDRAPVRQRARHEMLSATANRYPCGDGKWFVINMPDPSAFTRFCRAIGAGQLAEDERFKDASSRYRNMGALVAAVDAALAKHSRDEWGKVFDEAGLIWGPVLGLHEVANDPQAEAIGLFPTIEDAELGAYRSVRAPMRFRDFAVVPTRRAPTVGEHTRSVLRAAGVDDARIEALAASGVIRG